MHRILVSLVAALPDVATPAEFSEFIQKEQARWGEVVRKSGIKAE